MLPKSPVVVASSIIQHRCTILPSLRRLGYLPGVFPLGSSVCRGEHTPAETGWYTQRSSPDPVLLLQPRFIVRWGRDRRRWRDCGGTAALSPGSRDPLPQVQSSPQHYGSRSAGRTRLPPPPLHCSGVYSLPGGPPRRPSPAGVDCCLVAAIAVLWRARPFRWSGGVEAA